MGEVILIFKCSPAVSGVLPQCKNIQGQWRVLCPGLAKAIYPLSTLCLFGTDLHSMYTNTCIKLRDDALGGEWTQSGNV